MTEAELRDAMKRGLLGWYPFKVGSHLLCIQEEGDDWDKVLDGRGFAIDTLLITELEKLSDMGEAYDAIIAIHTIERIAEKAEFIRRCYKALQPDGVLLLGMDNRLGLRFFCGDRDPYSNHVFDSIDGYRRLGYRGIDRNSLKGMLLDRHTADGLLDGIGFARIKYYTIMPLLEMPQMIFSEDYFPKEELGTRYFPMYHYPDTAFLEEEHLYDVIIKNGLFHKLADSYLIECSKGGEASDILQVTETLNRSRRDSFITVVRGDNTVEKIPAYMEGRDKLRRLIENSAELKSRGLNVVDARMDDGKYVMPYIDAETAVLYFRRLFKENFEFFLKELDRYMETIAMSSDAIDRAFLSEEERELSSGSYMEKGYFDLVPINCFVKDGDFIFFDQEFCFERYPLNVLIYRAIDMIYLGREDLEYAFPQWKMWERYGIGEEIDRIHTYADSFLVKLRNEEALTTFNERYGSNWKMVARNRDRMNISALDDKRVFLDITEGFSDKGVVLYGAGKYAERFINEYGDRCRIEMIIDNDPKKQGNKYKQIKIVSLYEFLKLEIRQYKVMICIKGEDKYMPVLLKLQDAGIRDISIYSNDRLFRLKDILARQERIERGGR